MRSLLRACTACAALLVAGCGAKTTIPGALDTVDVVEASEQGPAGAGGQAQGGSGGSGGATAPGPAREDCYVPGQDKRPELPCLQRQDPRLPPLLPHCPSPAKVLSGPITDVNITLGTTRCCYDVSSETCE